MFYLFYVLNDIKIEIFRIKRKRSVSNEYESNDNKYMIQIDNELSLLENDINFTKVYCFRFLFKLIPILMKELL